MSFPLAIPACIRICSNDVLHFREKEENSDDSKNSNLAILELHTKNIFRIFLHSRVIT